MRALKIFRRQWFLLLLFVLLAAGFKYPAPGLWLKSHVPFVVKAAVIAALFLSSYGLPAGAIFRSLMRLGSLGLVFLAGYVLTPLLAWGAGTLIWGAGSELQTGLIIMAAMPCTLASAVIWTRLAKGNDALALAGTITTNLLNFIIAPVIFKLLLGTAMQVRVAAVMQGLFVTLVLPITAGQLARLCGSGLADRLRKPLSVVNRMLVLLMVWLSVCRAADSSSNLTVLTLVLVAVVCVVVHASVLGTAWLSAFRMNRADRIAVSIAGSQKTLIVALYVIEDFFPNVGLEVVPVLFFHAMQLVFDSVLVEFWSRRKDAERMEEPEDPT